MPAACNGINWDWLAPSTDRSPGFGATGGGLHRVHALGNEEKGAMESICIQLNGNQPIPFLMFYTFAYATKDVMNMLLGVKLDL